MPSDRSHTPTSFKATFTVAVVVSAAQVAAASILYLYWTKKNKNKNNKSDTVNEQQQQQHNGPPPKSILEFEQQAQHVLSPLAKIYFGYHDGHGVTGQHSRKALNAIRLVPRILVGDLSRVDTCVRLFDECHLDMPVLIAPTAFHCLACPEEGEVATARGAGQAGAGYCYNWMLSNRLCADVVQEAGDKWLQIYMYEERDLVEQAMASALATGKFSAVILTCDHPHQRVQNRMMPYFTTLPFPDKCYTDGPFFANQAAIGGDAITLKQLLTIDPDADFQDSTRKAPGGTNSNQLSWDHVQWIQSLTNLPIVAKGILSVDDARKAVQVGCSAIVVSNHGGRQFDGAPSAMDVLPMIVAAVGDQIPVLVDSGIRTSTDILKALCLGAKAVLLGRPPLWALACGGSHGLQSMLDTLQHDLQADMMSLGVTSLAELSPWHIWPPDRERIAADMRACGVEPWWEQGTTK